MSKKYLNLGCGQYTNSKWVNVDFIAETPDVIQHNLLEGVPFPDNEFDVVYHSHVLEHMPKDKVDFFIQECYRVLKPGGILRVATPDLENLARIYLENLDKALLGDEQASLNHEWMIMEMYDQGVRNISGGEVVKLFFQDEIPNYEFILKRFGYEAERLREFCLEYKKNFNLPKKKKKITFKRIKKFIKSIFKPRYSKQDKEYINIGRFRLSGEVHQWMYDKLSLKRLVEKNGFVNFKLQTAFNSDIEDFDKIQLDYINGNVRKPDSLFIEATK